MKQQLILLLLLFSLLGCGSDGGQTAVSTSTALTGTLTYMQIDSGTITIQEQTFADNQNQTLFTVPTNGWLSSAVLSPDGNQFLMAYAPPPAEGEIQFGYTKLYTMLREANATPRPLLTETLPDESFFNPTWGPNGRFIYYSHVTPDTTQANGFATTLERLEISTGQTAVLANNAIWPAISPDGTQIAYIVTDPLTLDETLYLADSNGSNARELFGSGYFPAVDALLFSPDGTHLYFSVAENEIVTLPWWQRLLGTKVAMAHNVPSNWWRINLTDNNSEQLTSSGRIGLFGTFAENGRYLVVASNNGLYLLNADGTKAEDLNDKFTFSVSWLAGE